MVIKHKIIKVIDDILTSFPFGICLIVFAFGMFFALFVNEIFGLVVIFITFGYLIAFIILLSLSASQSISKCEYEIIDQNSNWEVKGNKPKDIRCIRNNRIKLLKRTKHISVYIHKSEASFKISDKKQHVINSQTINDWIKYEVSLGIYYENSTELDLNYKTGKIINSINLNSVNHITYCPIYKLLTQINFNYAYPKDRVLKPALFFLHDGKRAPKQVGRLSCRDTPHWNITWDHINLKVDDCFELAWVWE